MKKGKKIVKKWVCPKCNTTIFCAEKPYKHGTVESWFPFITVLCNGKFEQED